MPYARKTDPYTSHEAADSVKNFTLTQQAIIRLLQSPMTDEDLVERYDLQSRVGIAPMASPSGIRTARHALVERGVVEAAGEGRSRFGRKALIWSVK
jgi:hypothetical protein